MAKCPKQLSLKNPNFYTNQMLNTSGQLLKHPQEINYVELYRES